MDDIEHQNLQFLGVYEILQETYKLIHKWRKIFTQITLVFILPLFFLLYTNINMEISHSFLEKITKKKIILQHTSNSPPPRLFLTLYNLVSSHRIIYYVLSNIASLIFLSIFRLLIITVVFYTITCTFTARDVSWKQVIIVLQKIWKRLLVKILFVFAAFVGFDVLSKLIAGLIYGPNDHNFGAGGIAAIVFFFPIIYFLVIWYLTIIRQLWRMVTKLSMWLNLGEVQIDIVYLVVRSASVEVVGKSVSLTTWILLFLLAKLVAGFVCKLYHRDNVDKLTSSNNLQSRLLGHYVLDDEV